jgi:predicted ribosomally synthesized peptide with SipW-like signal peptide
MKKILLSFMIIGVVAVVAFGATRAYFSDTDAVLGNTITTGSLGFTLRANRAQGDRWALHFPVELMPGSNTDNILPDGRTTIQMVNIDLDNASKLPNHWQFKFTTSNFFDNPITSGGVNTKDEYTKQLQVMDLHFHTVNDNGVWNWHGMKSLINDFDRDGVLTLYDLENTGVLIMNAVGTQTNRLSFRFKMMETADNKFQGDSLNLNIEVGAAQVAGQSVL